MARYEHRVGSLKALRRRNRGLVVAALRDAGTVSRRRHRARHRSVAHHGLDARRRAPGRAASSSSARRRGRHPAGDRAPARPALARPLGRRGALGVDFGHRHLRVAVSPTSPPGVLAERQDGLDVDRYAAPRRSTPPPSSSPSCSPRPEIDRATASSLRHGPPGPVDVAGPSARRSSCRAGRAPRRDELGLLAGCRSRSTTTRTSARSASWRSARPRRRATSSTSRSPPASAPASCSAGACTAGVAGIAGEIGHVQVDPGGASAAAATAAAWRRSAACPPLLEALRRVHGAGPRRRRARSSSRARATSAAQAALGGRRARDRPRPGRPLQRAQPRARRRRRRPRRDGGRRCWRASATRRALRAARDRRGRCAWSPASARRPRRGASARSSWSSADTEHAPRPATRCHHRSAIHACTRSTGGGDMTMGTPGAADRAPRWPVSRSRSPGCGDDDNGARRQLERGGGEARAKIALLLPESKTARYESQDRPLFEAQAQGAVPELRDHLLQRRPGRRQAAAAGRGGAHQGRQGARARPGRLGLGRRRSSSGPSSRTSRSSPTTA